jgi:DNA (cytosine-5)-methyltransferase 1
VPGIFPPGPADHDAWRAVFEHHPHLAPAIESGVRVLADGKSLVVDSCRADQLRCSGNGVVALQAAVAFTVLARRAGIDDMMTTKDLKH